MTWARAARWPGGVFLAARCAAALLALAALAGSAAAAEGRYLSGPGMRSMTIRPLDAAPPAAVDYVVRLALYSGSSELVLHLNLADRAGRAPSIDTLYDLQRDGAVWNGDVSRLVHGDGIERLRLRDARNLPGAHCGAPRLEGRPSSCYLDLAHGRAVAVSGNGNAIALETLDFSAALAGMREALAGRRAAPSPAFPLAWFEAHTELPEVLGLIENIDSVDGFRFAYGAAQLLADGAWKTAVSVRLNSIACVQHSRLLLGNYLADHNEQHIADVLRDTVACSPSVVPVFSQFHELTRENAAKRQALVKGFERHAQRYHDASAACAARVIAGLECGGSEVAEAPAATAKPGMPAMPADPALRRRQVDDEASRLLAFDKNPLLVFGLAEKLLNMQAKPNARASFMLAELPANAVARLAIFVLGGGPVVLKFGNYQASLDVKFEYVQTTECIVPSCKGSVKRKLIENARRMAIDLSSKNAYSGSRNIPLFAGIAADGEPELAKTTYSNLTMTVRAIRVVLQ